MSVTYNESSAQHDPAPTLRVLAVAEETAPFRELAQYAREEGAVLERARDLRTASHALAHGSWDLLLIWLGQGIAEGLSRWAEVLQGAVRKPRVIALVPAPSLALDAAQLGASEILPLPVERAQFCGLLDRTRAVEEEGAVPLASLGPFTTGPYPIVSGSPVMLPVFQAIAQVAPTGTSVLITGESGTGKELVARTIHQCGPRASGPFVAVNCAAIPETLLESELFGHEKGAFTGAISRKIGRFERASGGALFLDEISDMSLALQSKILRAIQEREIERVGGTEAIPVDARLIAAVNRDPMALVGQGRLREDLYYRLAVVTIKLPRLADRGEDLRLLTAHFLQEFGQRYGKPFEAISHRALELLAQHDWVGNVRELRNVIERAVLVSEGNVLRAEHLPDDWRLPTDPAASIESGALLTLREVETRHIARAMARAHGRIIEAARILGVHRNTLARKIKRYGL